MDKPKLACSSDIQCSDIPTRVEKETGVIVKGEPLVPDEWFVKGKKKLHTSKANSLEGRLLTDGGGVTLEVVTLQCNGICLIIDYNVSGKIKSIVHVDLFR